MTFIFYFVHDNHFFHSNLDEDLISFFFTVFHRYMVKKHLFCVGKNNFQRRLEEKDKSLGTIALKKVRHHIKLDGKFRKDLYIKVISKVFK